MPTFNQTVVGNTGQRSVSKSSSPPSASVHNQSSSVSIGQPGMAGSGSTQLNAPTNTTVQATPGMNPISYAAGQQPGAQQGLPPLDRNQINSYTEQFKSGALNPQQFVDQLKTYLSGYRDQVSSGIKGVIDDRTNAARQSAATARTNAQAQASQARQTATTTLNSARQAASAATAGSVPSGVNQALSDAERWLIERESGGDVNAFNQTPTDSGHAFGLGQLTTANRQKYAAALGVDPDTTDYNAQLQMMRMYISERYGSPEAAMAFWQQNGWY